MRVAVGSGGGSCCIEREEFGESGVLMALVMLSASVTGAEAAATADRRTPHDARCRPSGCTGVPPHYGFGYRYGLYPYDYYPGYYYPAYNPTAAVRVQVRKPEPTEVYVDGYLAGVADDFDGFFQRLRLPPGEYEIELRLDGYRSATERLLLTEGSTFRIRHLMVPLGPGETTPPPPEPTEPIDWSRYDDEEYDEYADPALADPRGGRAPVEPRLGRPAAAFGTFALRVQPPTRRSDRWRALAGPLGGGAADRGGQRRLPRHRGAPSPATNRSGPRSRSYRVTRPR